jgi:hypothetical protein
MTAEAFGWALRRHREARALSVRALAAKVNYSKSHISDLENGVRLPHRTLAVRLDEVLQTGGVLGDILLGSALGGLRLASSLRLDAYCLARPGGNGGRDDMKRRTLLGLGGVAGLGAVAPGITLESLRHEVESLTGERSAATADDWHEIATEYGASYVAMPPAQLLDSLVIDLVALHRAGGQHAGERRELRRAGGVLAAMMAMTVANLGQVVHAQRWWRTARRAAEHSGDRNTVLWVRGRETVRALYERRPITEILGLVAEAERYVTPEVPPPVVMELFGGKAQALAAAGRRADAVRAYRYFEELYPRLPSGVVADRDSLFGWPEEKLRFTESLVYAFLGDGNRAQAAQNRAVELYPSWDRRGPAQIELQRALCLVREGDVLGGVRHAQTVMTDLPRDQHIRPVEDLGRRVLEAVPVSERRLAPVGELGEYLRQPAGV